MSVILPTFNRERVVGRAIRSVLAQTLGDWELVVVDDGSRDDTQQAVKMFDDPRIRYLRNDRNLGPAAAQNIGLDQARAGWVAFLHSDDEFLPAKLERQLAMVAGAGGAAAVECRYEYVRVDGRTGTSPRRFALAPGDPLAFRDQAHLSTLMVASDLARQVRFDERCRGAEDRDFSIRLEARTPVVFLDETLARIHLHPLVWVGRNSKAPIYEYLFDKHRAAIEADRAAWIAWQKRLGFYRMMGSDPPAARRGLRQALRARPLSPTLWALWAAAHAGTRPYRAVVGVGNRFTKARWRAAAGRART